MILYFVTFDIYFFALGKQLMVFLLSPWNGGCTATNLENFQWGGHSGFFKSYSQKTKKVTYFQSHFFVFILTYFTNHFIPTPHFFTTSSHSYFLYHGVVVLFPSHLLSESKIFFNFSQEMTKNVFPKLIFFFSVQMQPGGLPQQPLS